MVAYHPVGFPGRPEQTRGTVAVVDDIWALVGSSTLSRRGLCFDGASDLVFMGNELSEGICPILRNMRRQCMGRVLGVEQKPDGSDETPDPRWLQLADPSSAFELMRQTLANNGEGVIQSIWRGLPESTVLSMAADIANPEGRDFSVEAGTLAAAISALGAENY